MSTASDLLKKYDIRPQKRLGQSFLIDPNIIAKIVQKATIRNDETVVEIGAGLGVMTALIAAQSGRVVALDIDPVMIGILREELREVENLEIVHTDVLRYDFQRALGERHDAGDRLKIIGNIPYNISTQILFRLLAYRSIISEMLLMFQKEVGERIIAEPGSKAYGILSVLTTMFADVSRVLNVPATCFQPAPKVDSIVLKIAFRKKPLIDLRDPELFFNLVKIGFAKRRKTLMNNLKSTSTIKIPDEDLAVVLKQAAIDGRRRGETLSPEEFGQLSNVLFDYSK